MVSRSVMKRRIPLATAVIAAGALCAFGIAPMSVSAATGRAAARTSGKVVCQTLTQNGDANSYILGDCTDREATGGSARVNIARLAEGTSNVTFHWASGKMTSFRDSAYDDLGACGLTPTVDSLAIVSGPIIKDTTGKITAPVSIAICTQPSGWTLNQPAKI